MSLFFPNYDYNRITDIKLSDLNAIGVKGLLLDVDNTLSTHHGQEPLAGLAEWINEMKEGGIRLIMLSNSGRSRLTPFAEKIGLDFIYHAHKPLPRGYFRGIKALGLTKKEVASVGDQLFTDVLGANLIGMPTICVQPILPETGWSFVIRRKLEAKLRKAKRR